VAGLLRLEALRSVREHGYQVAVYYQPDVPVRVRNAEGTELEGRTESASIWALYDLIRCDRPTADKALEQALAFLEMRCD